MSSRGFAVAALLVLADMSCASGTEKVLRRAVPATIDETIGTFEDPEIQRRLKKLIDLPDVQEAARRLAQGLTSGALDGLTDEQRVAKARALSEEYVQALTRAVGKGLHEEISPAVEGAVERTVARAVAAALSPKTRQDASALVASLTRSTLKTFAESTRDDVGPALQRVIEDNLGPALRKTIEKDLTPAVRDAMGGDLAPAAAHLSREVSREVVLGVVDAFAAIEHDERLAEFRKKFWGDVRATIDQGIRASEILAWILALIVVILGLVLIRAVVIRRHLESERERSERMLIGILHELQKSGEVRVEHVIEKVQARDPELGRSGYLNTLIQRAVALTRDLFDGKPDLDGEPDAPKQPPKA